MIKQIKLILALAFVNIAFAQHNTTGELETVTKDGLYEVKLPNEIRSFSKRDLSDFRIMDNNGKEAPYFIREKSSKVNTSEYIEFNVVSRETQKDTSSSIVFENPFKVIQEAILSVANYSGSKTYKISGSNDLEDWFGVLKTERLSNIQGLNNTSIDKSITFPRCEYKYLKIKFNDENTQPINILKVGSFANASMNRELQNVKIETMTISELAKEKKTLIHIKFKNKEIINQVQFKINAPELYNRQATIYKKATRLIKNKEETFNKQLAYIRLNSEKKNSFNISEIFEDEVYIEIDNKDSNSLSITNLSFSQKPLYVITSLKANENYTIKTGNETAIAPEYDLSFFKHNISENLPELKIKNVVKKQIKPEEKTQVSFWQKPWFMWLCIALTGFIILYFTSSLVKDLKKDKA